MATRAPPECRPPPAAATPPACRPPVRRRPALCAPTARLATARSAARWLEEEGGWREGRRSEEEGPAAARAPHCNVPPPQVLCRVVTRAALRREEGWLWEGGREEERPAAREVGEEEERPAAREVEKLASPSAHART
ncbi:hypothetical protein PVAP13_7NG213117 [Panicum virgatum]|uniref:Uncharacterized protein n=1 Tax=Panicum virgatum TaxID=38727 RepID=A0A8T0PS05_PANVG|nr:hypothetical protein PVAP13_7NG213117 [Panicum virgatum]